MTMPTEPTDYDRIAEAIRYLDAHHEQQPGLDDLAVHLHMSPYHLQRVFKRWAGISPKRFLQCITVEHAKRLLADSSSVLDATYAAGLSSPGRLHDLFVTVEAVTPGEFKAQGAGLTLAYGRHRTPFGPCLLAASARGVTDLAFVNGDGGEADLAGLRTRWPAANLVRDDRATAPYAERIFGGSSVADANPLPLHLKGTNFQLKVWQALLRIPAGHLCAYVDVAAHLGQPRAAQAVGQAVGANPIAYLIPCHRVIRQTGVISDYRWGAVRKKAILGWEMARYAA